MRVCNRTSALLALGLALPFAGAAPRPCEAARDNLSLADLPEGRREVARKAIDDLEAFRKKKKGAPRLSIIIRRLEKARLKAPKAPQLYFYLGIAYQLAESYSRAASRLRTAINLNPEFHEAYVEYGDVFVWRKEYKKAIAQYDKAIELAPKYDLAYERRGWALIRLGEFKDARKYIEKAIDIRRTPYRDGLLARLHFVLRGPSWKETYTKETANYIVKTSVSQKYADKIAESAERIRNAYVRVFPKTKRPERKFPIYVHSSRQEYIRNGGPPMAGGHYEPDFRILVLFRQGATTITVLYHEAFHQFIHDYIEQPPQWFNEGVADYFGGFRYVAARKAVVPRPNTMRLAGIKAVIQAGRYADPGELMLMTQAEMYDPQMVAIHYAQAWSMVYFMLENKKGKYRKTLVRYFDALRKGKNIEEAYKTTFGRTDMERFERDWKSFTMSIRP